MPKATVVWLVENTVLTFEQIAEFCGMHPLEVQAIADDEVAVGVLGLDPITHGQLTAEEIERCAADAKARLRLATPTLPLPQSKPKGARYTPVSKRQDRPDAIAWLVKNYPELSDAQLSKLIGTTKPTINAVREKTHWNASNIKPQNPIGLGLCGEAELEKAVNLARARAGTVHGAADAQPVPTPVQVAAPSIEKAAAGKAQAKSAEPAPLAPEEAPPGETAEKVFGVAPEPPPPPATTPESVETVFGGSAKASKTVPEPKDEPSSEEAKPSPGETPSRV
jgi:hypothetical protein